MAAEGESLSDSQSEVSNASDRLLVFGPNKGATPPPRLQALYILPEFFVFVLDHLLFRHKKILNCSFYPAFKSQISR